MPKQTTTATKPQDPALDGDDNNDITVPDAPILYSSRALQRIPLTLTHNGRDIAVAHNIGPLHDSRYFEYQLEIEGKAAKSTDLSSDLLYGAKQKLWREIADSREGYVEREDWRQKTHQVDAAKAIDIFLGIVVKDSAPNEEETETVLFDDDALTRIEFATMFSGTLLTGLSHSFRGETQAEMDSFMAIETGELNPNVLASAEKLSNAEKLCRLGKSMLQESVGYAPGTPVPAWHLAGTTRSFFLKRLSRMGKS